jgi:hypothetical protein
MANFESHDATRGTKEMVASLPNVVDSDINTAHKLSFCIVE